jgi:drug/metabolite transporter (DMT)-like permease
MGLDRTTATHAALLVGTGPPLLGLTAWGLGLEELRRKDWAAIVLSVLGVMVMVGIPSAGGDLLGDALVLLSMAISTAWVLLSQRLARSLGAAVATAWILLAGTVAVAPLFVVTGLPSLALETRTWLALLTLGLGCTVGSFLLWNWGATRLPAGRAGVFLNLEPVSGVLLGVFLLGETAGVPVLVGGAIVTLAAVLASTGGAPESARARGRLRGREQQDARPPGAVAAREALSSPPKRSTERQTRTGTYEPNDVIACRRYDRRRDSRTSAGTGSRG